MFFMDISKMENATNAISKKEMAITMREVYKILYIMVKEN